MSKHFSETGPEMCDNMQTSEKKQLLRILSYKHKLLLAKSQ